MILREVKPAEIMPPPVADTQTVGQGIPVEGLVPAILLSFGVVVALMVRAGLSVRLEPRLVGLVFLYAAVAIGMMGLSRMVPSRRARACSDAAEYVTIFASICLLGALASYPIAASSRGFSDASLERFDRLVRFDWLSWYELVARHPLLQLFERAAYENIFLLPVIILTYFAVARRRAEAMRFMMAYWLAAIITLIVFYMVPMRGPLAMLLAGSPPYVPISALYQAQIIAELRAHQLHQVDLDTMRGLVGAPSFHAASAVLFAIAGWSSKTLRWPIAALNAAMLLATPVEGTHYVGDILAGALVALVALAITIAIEEWLGRRLMRG